MYIRFTYPKLICLDNNGIPAAGYEIYTYLAGTSSVQETYSERTLTSANPNPIILDARGEADVYCNVALKLAFTIPGGDPASPIWVVDYVGEQQGTYIITGTGVSDDYNNYTVDIVPPFTAIPDNLTVVFTPDKDSKTTLAVESHALVTGINDLQWSGPYVGTTPGSIFKVTIDNAFEAPPTAPTLAENPAAGSVTAGGHSVAVTFITALGETSLGTASNIVAAAGSKKLDVSGIPLGSSQVTSRKIYMTKAGLYDYYFVYEIPDNSTTTYTVDVADAGLTVAAPTADTTGSGDTFSWQKDGGTITSSVAITGVAQSLIEGIEVTFSVLSGHTLGDIWTLEVMTPATLDFCSLGAQIIYKNVAGSLKALDAGDMKDGISATIVWTGTNWILNNPSLPVLTPGTQIPRRIRKRVVSEYTVVAADQGSEISCADAPYIVYLDKAANLSGLFFYIRREGPAGAIITITVTGTSPSELIYGPGDTVGATTFVLDDTVDSVQLQCNGVDFHVLANTYAPPVYYSWMTHGVYTWTCPVSWTEGILVTGSAAGANGQTTTNQAGREFGAGGGAGRGVFDLPLTPTPGTVYTITVGAVGNTGGDTTISGGLLTLAGGVANAGDTGGNFTEFTVGGAGQSSLFGGGGPGKWVITLGTPNTANGKDAVGYGAGGGGAATRTNTPQTGGAGAPGFLTIRNAARSESY